MMKAIKVLYYASLSVSMLVGLWHFFVPRLFDGTTIFLCNMKISLWGIDYTNYCFSALLFGISLVLIILGKSALSFNRETIIFYTFLTAVWVFRACLAVFIEPWPPLEPVPAVAIGQLVASVLLAIMMVIVSLSLWWAIR